MGNFLINEVVIGELFNSPFGKVGGKNLGNIVTFILESSFVIAGILILFFLIFGGVSIIAGAGQNNPEQAAKGKQAVTSAVIGFIIVFVAYWIIRIIEIILGVNFITQPGGF